ETSGPHSGARGEVLKRAAGATDEYITGIDALRIGGEFQTRIYVITRNVLQAMNREVNRTGKQFLFDSTRENALVPDLRNRAILYSIPFGAHNPHLKINLGMVSLEQFDHERGLSQGQPTASCSNY